MTPRRATLAGFAAVLLWSSLAVLTGGTAGIPPFQLLAMGFGVAGRLLSPRPLRSKRTEGMPKVAKCRARCTFMRLGPARGITPELVSRAITGGGPPACESGVVVVATRCMESPSTRVSSWGLWVLIGSGPPGCG